MNVSELLTKRLYKWIILYPWLRKIANWAYFELAKMPQYHIALRPGDVGRYVLLPDDPGAAPQIASFLDQAQKVAQHREYLTYTGTLDGVKVSITSTGIGGPCTAIAIEELAQIGADTFICLGNSRPVQSFVKSGDLIVATGAVRDEGTGLAYIPLAYPALAEINVVTCLRQACRARGVRHHVGLSHSHDSFYGMAEPERMPVGAEIQNRWQSWVQGGVLCSEMTAATTFIVSSALKKRAGAIALVSDGEAAQVDELYAVAVEGLRRLIARDEPQG